MLCICFCDILPCKSSCSSISQHWILVNCIHCVALRFMREVGSSQQCSVMDRKPAGPSSLTLDQDGFLGPRTETDFFSATWLMWQKVFFWTQIMLWSCRRTASIILWTWSLQLKRTNFTERTKRSNDTCNNCKRWHSYRGKIVANCSIMHSIIIYREGLDLTLPILPCLQFFGHGGEEYSKCRIEKWNCMLATSTGWRMSSTEESARQLHGKTVHFEAFECIAAKSSKLQSGERHRWRCAYQDRIISASNNNPTSFCGLPPPPTIIWKNSRWSFETWTRTIIWILDNGTHDIWNWRSHRMSTSISLYLELCLLDLSFICPFQPCTHFCQI